ncbi:MAG: acyltransferase [Proteobacteria bacterium]|nr:acyltransferase [Pseudomonadota bacterium]
MKRRFHSLDGLRGVCALAILFFHARVLAGSPLFAHAYLSVDMFFLISGFVLSQAYGTRLTSARDRGAFAVTRIRRLAPSLWFGIVLGVVFQGALVWLARPGGHVHTLTILAILAVLNALLIPIAGLFSQSDAFAPNNVSWSLFAEMAVNAGFAFLSPLMNLRHLAVAVFSSALLFSLIGWQLGTLDFGAHQDSVLLSIPRAVPTFATGMLVHKLWESGKLERLPRLPPSLICIGWFVLMALYSGPVWLDLMLVLLVSPVLLGLLVRGPDKISERFVWLGAVSYPLYATHAVILNFVLGAGLPVRLDGTAPWTLPLTIAFCIAVAEFVRRWIEPGARNALAARSPKPVYAEIPGDMRIRLF